MTRETLCACKDRAASACPGEWEKGCDLGANAAHVAPHELHALWHSWAPPAALKAALGEIERLRARVLELEAVHEDANRAPPGS